MNKKKVKNNGKTIKKLIKKDINYVVVLMEDMRDKFRSFGESLAIVRDKGEATFEKVGRIKEEVTSINFRLDKIECRLDNIEKELLSIKLEITDLKQLLTQKADIEKLMNLEERVKKIEAVLRVK